MTTAADPPDANLDWAFLDGISSWDAFLQQPLSPIVSGSVPLLPQHIQDTAVSGQQPFAVEQGNTQQLLGLAPYQQESAAMQPTISTAAPMYEQPQQQQYQVPAFADDSAHSSGGCQPQLQERSSGDGNSPHHSSADSAQQQHTSQQGIKKEEVDAEEVGKARQQLNRHRQTNRNAQKRYRDRQKTKLQDSEEKVAELTEQLISVRLQKSSLAMRNALLEKLLAMQTQQVASGTAAFVENSPASWWLDAPTRRLLEELLQLGPTVTLTVLPGGPQTFTRNQLEEMPLEALGNLLQLYINAFAEVLLSCDGDDPASPSNKQLDQLVLETWQLQAVNSLSRPDAFHRFKIKQMEGKPQLTTQQQRLAVLRSMNLRDNQKQALVGLRKIYLTNLGALVHRREALTAALQTEPSGQKEIHASIMSADELRGVLREEHSLQVQYMLACWRFVLTPFQVASRMLEGGCGHHVDILSLSNLLAEQAGLLADKELLAKGAAQAAKGEELLPMDAAIAVLPQCMAGDWSAVLGPDEVPSPEMKHIFKEKQCLA